MNASVSYLCTMIRFFPYFRLCTIGRRRSYAAWAMGSSQTFGLSVSSSLSAEHLLPLIVALAQSS